MSDETTTPNTEAVEPAVAQEAPAEEQAAQEPKTFDEEYVKKLRDENASWRTKLRESEEKARQYDELVEAQKSEEQKRAEELEATKAELDSLKRDAQVREWTAEVSKETGVPASALRGSSLEEIQAHAEELKSFIGQKAEPVHQPVPSAGNEPGRTGNVSIGEQIAAAEAAGNKELVAALKAAQLGS